MGSLTRCSIGLALLACLLVLASGSARACSCAHPDPSDYLKGVDQVFDGYIVRISRDETGKYPVMKAHIRVDKVWKGVLPDNVIFAYGEADAACQYGSLRASVHHRFYTRGDPATGFLGASWCDRMIGSPRNTALQDELIWYSERWRELSGNAKAGGVAEKFVFAQFLLDYGDEKQAVDAYQEVISIDQTHAAAWLGLSEALANLGRAEESSQARQRAGSLSPAMRGPVLRAEFERTGRLDPTWKDWSNLTTRAGCNADGMELSGMTFRGSQLHNCSFLKATLRDVDFTGARMFASAFDGGALHDIVFRDAMLNGVAFKGAEIADTVLSGQINGDFSDAHFARVIATGVRGELNLQRAQLDEVDFSRAYLGYLDARGARFEGVNLTGADLTRGKLQGADLSGATLTGADLSMAHIDCQTKLPPALDIQQIGIIPEEPACGGHAQNRDFSNRSWRHADFKKLDLRGADFSGSDLNIAHFQDADLRGANLSNTKGLGGLGLLRGANLDGAVLDGAQVEQMTVGGISLKGATFRGATIQMRDIVTADPRFSSIDLDEPDFDGAILDCGTYDFEWIDRQKTETQRNVAEQVRVEAAAINRIRAKWPTVEQTSRCTQYLTDFQARCP
jgi:uncharacterized protein YjbI with pentapeptide repeats